MYRRIVTFVFPVILIFAELIARIFAQNEANRFLAPTVTSIALGLLFPVLAPEDYTKHLPKSKRQNAVGTVAYNKADEVVSQVANVLLYPFTLVWVLLLFLSIRSSAAGDPALLGHATWIYSVLIYFACASLAEVKESI